MENKKMVGRVIKIFSNKIKRYIDNAASQNDVTGVHVRIIHFILAKSLEKDVFQKDIEEEFHIRRSSASGILRLMEKNGMIKRESVPYDARLKKIILTAKALELKERVINDILDLEKLLTQNITEEELELFFRIVERMSKNLE